MAKNHRRFTRGSSYGDYNATRLSGLSAAAVSVGCAARGTEALVGAASVRQPTVGQTWQYAKHDFFTGAIVESQVDRVSAMGQSIQIESHSEALQNVP